jgi:hypothetical protein
MRTTKTIETIALISPPRASWFRVSRQRSHTIARSCVQFI